MSEDIKTGPQWDALVDAAMGVEPGNDASFQVLHAAGKAYGALFAEDAGDGPRAPNFGRNKNQPLKRISEKDLRWYVEALQRSIQDPDKERFIQANMRDLEAVTAELERRR